jgi:stage II sporulation protein D
MTIRRHLTALAVVLGCLVAAAPASAASRLTVRGAGWGHGVGMSQYGAMGFAQRGSDYRAILGHYYSNTTLGAVDPARQVRVLLQSVRGRAAFSGASRAGDRRLSPSRTYFVRARGGGAVDLVSASGRRIGGAAGVLRASGPGPLRLKGRAGNGRVSGRYRGALEFRPGVLGGVNAINAVGMEDYLRGVVPDESPPSWPIEALKAQAVAARTYAIATSKAGAGFDQYPDTRSQVYGGVAAEEPSTDEAVAQTRGQVVTYNGEPVITYFFSTSGGRTEDVENTSLGDEPRPWLKSVEDPYDDVSPRHRWTVRMSLANAQGKLGGLVKGSLRGIRALRRGSSPRIVEGEIVGSAGTTRVSGATLRAKLGLFDTWAYFTSLDVREEPPDDNLSLRPDGGATVSRMLRRPAISHLKGRVMPGRRGDLVVIERKLGDAWAPAGSATIGRGGRYRFAVTNAGLYRISHGGAVSGPVRVG